MDSELKATITQAAASARALNPRNEDALIELGVSLESLLEGLSEHAGGEACADEASRGGLAELARLLGTALDSLREVFQRTAADPETSLDGVR